MNKEIKVSRELIESLVARLSNAPNQVKAYAQVLNDESNGFVSVKGYQVGLLEGEIKNAKMMLEQILEANK